MSANTLIVGATLKTHRFAFKALKALQENKHSVLLFSPRGGVIEGLPVVAKISDITEPVDTVTLYVNPERLLPLLDDIIGLSPRRVIFNPGTESAEAYEKLKIAGIESIVDCTLIMLRESYF